jgi:hypothetical protein
MDFSGYQVSGSIYLDEICFDNHCMTTTIYVADEIFSDSYMLDQKGAFGVLGFGPESPLWV